MRDISGFGKSDASSALAQRLWVTFKPAGESEIVELYRRLVKRKIEFGRLLAV